MLKLKNIKKDYCSGSDNVIHALKGINLNFRENEFVAILGHSGCGKTTLLNIIGGLDRFSSGDLIINGKSTKDFSDRDWDSYRNHSVGFVFQSYNLIPHQTVLANVELALTLTGVSKSERRKRAIAVLEEVGLGDQINKKPNQMSGGQMQRVAIARALVNDPDILLADEPTGALDSETSIQIMNILKEVAKTRLIIMVTHNPELAEYYATRTVRITDGEILSDSNPYDAEDETALEVSEKKPAMSVFTALSLSLNNLLTKKARTFLTAFAGSIGIIGIALILSLSTGVQNYINKVQEDTLSSYPITLEAESVDMSSMITSLMGVNKEEGESDPHELDAVYSNTILYDMMDNLANTEVQTNNLKDFKTFLENDGSSINDYISAVSYSYNLDMNIYAKDIDGVVFKSDIISLLENCMSAMYGGDYSSYFSTFGSAYSRMEVWQEMLPAADGEDGLVSSLLYDQYDVLYGSWPNNYDEAVLIVDKNNEISDLVIYSLGLGSQSNVINSFSSVMNMEDLNSFSERWDYSEICNMTYKIILDYEQYQYDSNSGGYTNVSDTEAGMEFLYNDEKLGTTVKIVGIIRPNQDAAANMMSGAIGYTSALTEYLIAKTAEAEILTAQKGDESFDIIKGLPFMTDDCVISEEEKIADIKEYISDKNVTEKSAMYISLMSVPSEDYLQSTVNSQLTGITRADIEASVIENYSASMNVDKDAISGYISSMDDETLLASVAEMMKEQVRDQYASAAAASLSSMTNEQLAGLLDTGSFEDWQYLWLYDNYMPPAFSDGSYENNMKLLGDVNLDNPKTISIYASTFENKDNISKAIEDYNAGKDEDDKIEYTDYVALLMSSITTIINAISYVLIAFVAISLVVSSIMIGIITYISVLERTKEIGILRAIGARKKDVSNVFNAETIIVGFCAGVIGIVVTLLLLIPINIIVHKLTGIMSLSAVLPVDAAIILVLISIVLTFIAGLIPSGMAAKKDPVEALRTD